jgi:hypothetical protein
VFVQVDTAVLDTMLTTMEPCSGSFAVVRIPVDLGMKSGERSRTRGRRMRVKWLITDEV